MEISIESVDKETIKIHVKGEGLTLVNMLRYKLLDNKNVVVAGYKQDHPLVDKTTLLVKAKTNPKKAVVSSLKQLGKEGTRVITPDVATQIARKAKAKWMLTGSIVETEPTWIVTAQLSEVATGDVLASPTIEGQSGERVYEVVDRLTAQIKSDLAIPAHFC